jgi:hypothetical protein
MPPVVWLNGPQRKAWGTLAALPVIRRPTGKVERWHRALKNRILLENDYFSWGS